jgi:hypothetical protein
MDAFGNKNSAITPPVIGKDGVIAIRPYSLQAHHYHLWIVARKLSDKEYVVHTYNGCQGCEGYAHGTYCDTLEQLNHYFLNKITT